MCVARVLSRMHGRMGKHRDRACDDGCDMLQVCVTVGNMIKGAVREDTMGKEQL